MALTSGTSQSTLRESLTEGDSAPSFQSNHDFACDNEFYTCIFVSLGDSNVVWTPPLRIRTGFDQCALQSGSNAQWVWTHLLRCKHIKAKAMCEWMNSYCLNGTWNIEREEKCCKEHSNATNLLFSQTAVMQYFIYYKFKWDLYFTNALH